MNFKNLKTNELEKYLKNRIPHPQGIHTQNSVMVLLFEKEASFHILYTQRALSLSHQPGDICFPGGKKEGNETALETALRETQEELNVSQNKIHVLGQTDYIITNQGSIIYPFLGYVKNLELEKIIFNKEEVEKIFSVPLSFFSQTPPKTHYIYYKPYIPEDFPYELIMGGKNYPFSSPKMIELFYEYDGNIIWGLTARITEHILKLIAQIV